MSQETSQWLNQNTLIGFTDKRGEAWHYRASDQGDEPNHYPGAIPVEDVRRRLFHWQPVEGSITTTYKVGRKSFTVEDTTRKAIVRPDTSEVLGVFKTGFQIHEYGEWLVTNVESLLDDDLSVGSAGLLRGGAVAWVQVEMPDTITTPEGVAFRPHLSAATSLDGSLASTYQTGSQVIVCDNTLAAALSEKDSARIKVKHSRHSMGRVMEVREALQIVHTISEEFAAQVAALSKIEVSDKDWAKFLTAHFGDKDDARLSDRSRTIAARKHTELTTLWQHDERVAPWKGTAWGVLQAVNTHGHHVATVKRTNRVERNMLNAITGKTAQADRSAVSTLLDVLAVPA